MATLKSNRVTDGTPARQVHAGAQSLDFYYSVTANLSVGDVIQLAKLPDGAHVTDLKVWHTTGNIAFDIGVGGDTDLFIDSASVVTGAGCVFGVHAQTNVAGYNTQIAVSDGAADQWDTVDLTILVVTTATAAGAIYGSISYNCDEAPETAT